MSSVRRPEVQRVQVYETGIATWSGVRRRLVHVSTHSNIRPETIPRRVRQSAYSPTTTRTDSRSKPDIGRCGVGLLYDTRDNGINAQKGWLVNSTYRTFYKDSGGDSTWQELIVDVRTYKSSRRAGSEVAFGDSPTSSRTARRRISICGDRQRRSFRAGTAMDDTAATPRVRRSGIPRTLTRNGLSAWSRSRTPPRSTIRGAKNLRHVGARRRLGLRVLPQRSRTNLAADYAVANRRDRLLPRYQEAF